MIPSQLQPTPKGYNCVSLTVYLSLKRRLCRLAADAVAACFRNIAAPFSGGDCVVSLARRAAVVYQSVFLDRVAILCYGGGDEKGGDAEEDGFQMHGFYRCGGVEVGICIVRMVLVWSSGLNCNMGNFALQANGVYKYMEIS